MRTGLFWFMRAVFFFFFLLRPKGETKTYISHPEPPPLRHNGTCLTKGCFFGFHHMQRRMDPRGRNPIRCVMFSGQAENGQQQHRGFSAQDPGRKLQAANTGSLDISRYLRLLIHSWLLPALWDWTHTGSLSLSLSPSYTNTAVRVIHPSFLHSASTCATNGSSSWRSALTEAHCHTLVCQRCCSGSSPQPPSTLLRPSP